MKILRQLFLIGLAVATVSFAAAEDNPAIKKDLALLQGEWSMVSGSADGKPMPAELASQMKRICKGDETTAMMAGNVFFKAKITIDPTKEPKAIDYAMTEGFTKGKTQRGIYEISGDTLKSCFGPPDAERPTDFTSKVGDRRTFSVWKRDKPATPAPEKK